MTEDDDAALRFLEIRTYRLVPGTRGKLHDLLTSGPLPALARYGITLVDYGPSVTDDDGVENYYLLRAFPSLAERQRREEAFYGGTEWRERWREDVLACIEDYHTVVIEVPPEVIAGMRHRRPS